MRQRDHNHHDEEWPSAETRAFPAPGRPVSDEWPASDDWPVSARWPVADDHEREPAADRTPAGPGKLVWPRPVVEPASPSAPPQEAGDSWPRNGSALWPTPSRSAQSEWEDWQPAPATHAELDPLPPESSVPGRSGRSP